uniref:uncharacterized protein LOC120331758 isoform X2 n=1 Tax=Styela clava TaxID=7725 RepID=UPI00193AC15A|nr:uncharacterized protein LOC120331758 isoform X2 [Styela clava]
MTNRCCVPQCDSVRVRGSCTLFLVPSKRFCSGEKFIWADKLEKIVMGLRADSNIKYLYLRDRVKICERHFEENDIQKIGTQLRLRIGAIPKLNMPQKSCSKLPTLNRSSKEKKVAEKIHHKNLQDLKKSASNYLPSNWKYQDSDDSIQLFLKPKSAAEQSSLAINIDSELHISALYHGWTSVTSEVLNNIDIKHTTLSNILHIIYTSIICEGITGSSNSSSTTSQHFEVSFSRTNSEKFKQGLACVKITKL